MSERTERLTLAEQLAQIAEPAPQGPYPFLPCPGHPSPTFHHYISRTAVTDLAQS
jgi:hypothetical protein